MKSVQRNVVVKYRSLHTSFIGTVTISYRLARCIDWVCVTQQLASCDSKYGHPVSLFIQVATSAYGISFSLSCKCFNLNKWNICQMLRYSCRFTEAYLTGALSLYLHTALSFNGRDCDTSHMEQLAASLM